MTITTSNGSLTGAADNVTVPENTTVTVTLFPRDGYTVQLVVNGNQVTLNNNVYTVETSANQPELKFEACFTNLGGGNNPGNPNPPAGNQKVFYNENVYQRRNPAWGEEKLCAYSADQSTNQ